MRNIHTSKVGQGENPFHHTFFVLVSGTHFYCAILNRFGQWIPISIFVDPESEHLNSFQLAWDDDEDEYDYDYDELDDEDDDDLFDEEDDYDELDDLEDDDFEDDDYDDLDIDIEEEEDF